VALTFMPSAEVSLALAVGAVLPLTLAAIARVPAVRGKNAIQFLLAALVSVAFWHVLLACCSLRISLLSEEYLVGVMVLASSFVFWLQPWGLLSRGYSLGMLLTLYKSDGPMTVDQLSAAYRGNAGVEWVARHRIDGLVRFGVVAQRGDSLVLTPVRGRIVAIIYAVAVSLLSLERMG
jgi:hypothetical protein